MGTIVVIDVYATAGSATTDTAALRASQEIIGQLAEAVATLHRADEIFSTWKPGQPRQPAAPRGAQQRASPRRGGRDA